MIYWLTRSTPKSIRHGGEIYEYSFGGIYPFSRGTEFGRNSRRLGCCIRAYLRETVEKLDRHISANYRGDQPHGIPVPIPQVFAIPRRRHRFLAGFGADDSGVLRLPSCRCVAWRLPNRLGYSALSERIRFDRTVFHEDSRAQGTCAYRVRTAISRDASCGDVDFYRAWGFRDQAISGSTGSRRSALKSASTCFVSCPRIDCTLFHWSPEAIGIFA